MDRIAGPLAWRQHGGLVAQPLARREHARQSGVEGTWWTV